MEKLKVNPLKIEVSRIGLGSWSIGGWMWGGSDDRDAVKTVIGALEKGINLIDTAPIYGFGHAEKIVGEALSQFGHREEIIVSTKCALEWDEDENVRRNSSRERILKEVDDSLSRLGVDYLDVYFIHWPDKEVAFEETAETMKELFDQGKIRAIGVSNYDIAQMDAFRRVAPLHFLQPPYNIFERGIEEDLVPYCLKNNIALMTYGSLCRGLLSGKIDLSTEFHGDDLRKVDPKFQGERFKQYLQVVDSLEKYAREKYQKHVIHLALRWLIDVGIEVSLLGARKPHHLDILDEIDDFKLMPADLERIRQITEETISDPVGPEFMAPPE